MERKDSPEFPVIRNMRDHWERLQHQMRSGNHKDWNIIGKVALQRLKLKFYHPEGDILVFPLNELKDLRVIYWGYDHRRNSPTPHPIARHLYKGNMNYLKFQFRKRTFTIELYIESLAKKMELIRILEAWYREGNDFAEYYGKIPSFLLKPRMMTVPGN